MLPLEYTPKIPSLLFKLSNLTQVEKIMKYAQQAWDEIKQSDLDKMIAKCWRNMEEAYDNDGDYGPSVLKRK